MLNETRNAINIIPEIDNYEQQQQTATTYIEIIRKGSRVVLALPNVETLERQASEAQKNQLKQRFFAAIGRPEARAPSTAALWNAFPDFKDAEEKSSIQSTHLPAIKHMIDLGTNWDIIFIQINNVEFYSN